MVVLPTPPLSAPTRITDGFIFCPAPCASVVEASVSGASLALLDELGFGCFDGFRIMERCFNTSGSFVCC